MTPVSLKKVSRGDASSLQEMVKVYSDSIHEKINQQLTITFYDQMLETDILSDLWFLLRTKIEGRLSQFSLSLKVPQAVVLVYALNHCIKTDNEYAILIIKKYMAAIDKDLKGRIIIKPGANEGPLRLYAQPPLLK